MTTTPTLFTPTRLGAIDVKNRIAMAPLTRSRAGMDGVQTPLAATYYAQRASAGLLIAEATDPASLGAARTKIEALARHGAGSAESKAGPGYALLHLVLA